MSFTAAASKTTFLAPSLSATTKTTTRSTSRGGVGVHQSASKGRRCVQVRAGEDVVVSIDELTETTRKAIKTYGYDDKATECILDILMYAQLRGNNQGACR
jgi:ABC-type proline/glycine betaine transport system substrate-binding protein